MDYEHSSGTTNLEDIRNGLQATLDLMPSGLAQDGITTINGTLETLYVATQGSNNPDIAALLGSLGAAASSLESASNAAQKIADELVAYAGRVGLDGLPYGAPGNTTYAPPTTASFASVAETAGPSKPRQVEFYRLKVMSPGVVPRTGKPGAEQDIIDNFARGKQQLLEAFPSDTTGLDTARVDRFMDSLGIKRTDTIILPLDQRDRLLHIINKILRIRLGKIAGVYNPDLDLVIAFREPIGERENGPAFTETTVVHEKAHGSSEHYRIISVAIPPRNPAVYTPRAGFLAKPYPGAPLTGNFIEEGFAEYVRSLYIVDALGLPRGFIDQGKDVVPISMRKGVDLPLPAKYYYRGDNGKPDAGVESFAAAALDHLIERDPELFPAMLRARKNEDGIDEFADRIDAISPGLYNEMRRNFNSQYTFDLGYRHVLQSLGVL
ncbi:MAG TPA: hypothetical protein VMR45_03390 [Patescibacteria group bacterium]|nr:hypothetical protein [Patescibacteria group bacterium]